MQIIGAGRDKTFITNGGFEIRGTKEEGEESGHARYDHERSEWCGLYNDNGLSFLCKDMTFTQCGDSGVLR